MQPNLAPRTHLPPHGNGGELAEKKESHHPWRRVLVTAPGHSETEIRPITLPQLPRADSHKSPPVDIEWCFFYAAIFSPARARRQPVTASIVCAPARGQ